MTIDEFKDALAETLEHLREPLDFGAGTSGIEGLYRVCALHGTGYSIQLEIWNHGMNGGKPDVAWKYWDGREWIEAPTLNLLRAAIEQYWARAAAGDGSLKEAEASLRINPEQEVPF